jgi:hypothetical protein
MLSLALHICAWWLALSFLAGSLWALAGYRIHRKQESQSFASDGPLRYLELDASQFRRLP